MNIAIIGCGRILKKHIEAIQDNGLNLVAMCDSSKKKLDDAFNCNGKKHNLPRGLHLGFTDYKEMLEKCPKIDIVAILTEAGNHWHIACEVAKYKKHIIVEKPMAITLQQADAMIKAADENGVKLFVVKQNRYNKPVLKLREALESGRFGNLVLGTIRVRWSRDQAYYDMDAWRGTWSLEGGVLASQASHHLDMLQWMMGPIKSVFAKGTTHLDIEVEDTATVQLEFESGALGLIEATVCTRPKNLEGSISILGEHGTVVIGGFAVNLLDTWTFDDGDKDHTDIWKYSENPPDVYGYGHKLYYKNVIDTINGNGNALVDGIEGRKTVELFNACYESMETGKEVFMRYSPRIGK